MQDNRIDAQQRIRSEGDSLLLTRHLARLSRHGITFRADGKYSSREIFHFELWQIPLQLSATRLAKDKIIQSLITYKVTGCWFASIVGGTGEADNAYKMESQRVHYPSIPGFTLNFFLSQTYQIQVARTTTESSIRKSAILEANIHIEATSRKNN